jgi:hypothetical protein
LAYLLCSLVLHQFETNKEEIMVFINFLLKEEEEGKGKERNKLSLLFLIGITLLALSPGIHAKLVEESPCTPHFLISLTIKCGEGVWILEEEGMMMLPLYYKILWMLPEYYLTTLMFTSWSFNWASIFLGLSYIQDKLSLLRY